MIAEILMEIHGFFSPYIGEMGAVFATSACVAMAVGTIVFLILGLFKGSKYLNELVENENKFLVVVGVPSAIICMMILWFSGIV